jgi:hypothetical protein
MFRHARYTAPRRLFRGLAGESPRQPPSVDFQRSLKTVSGKRQGSTNAVEGVARSLSHRTRASYAVGADLVAAFREEELTDARARGGCLSGTVVPSQRVRRLLLNVMNEGLPGAM